MKRFVIGDIHGGYKALLQCLEKSNFDYENDLLISVGDIADGWSEVSECVTELLKIKNLIVIEGNHDNWFIQWIEKGTHPVSWLQGGHATLMSYIRTSERRNELQMISHDGAFLSNMTKLDLPEGHLEFWSNLKPYYILDEDKVFVHGGFNKTLPIESQHKDYLMWDRNMLSQAVNFSKREKYLDNPEKSVMYKNANNFKEIFVGHTTTSYWTDEKNNSIFTPIHAVDVWDLDTGGGWDGKLTIMDIDTKEYWQSDFVKKLYKDEKGR